MPSEASFVAEEPTQASHLVPVNVAACMSCHVQVHEKDFQHDEDGAPLPLPSVGEIERPQSAVDTASLHLPSDLSVSSLRYAYQ